MSQSDRKRDRELFMEHLKLLCEIFSWHREECIRCAVVRWLFGHGKRTDWYCARGRNAWGDIEYALAHPTIDEIIARSS